ncbi:hypothetical protein ACQUFE_18040, partial [Enterococcus casseliflavus]|uniref:hypothetical protein n=1 Tax=Enterococcus casseliflavus TaxID=37734 RepID=UPI003D09B29A
EDNICSPTSVKDIIRRVPSIDKQLVFLKNCGHVLLGTSFIKPEVSKLVMDWLSRHTDIALAARGKLAQAKSTGGQIDQNLKIVATDDA